jgi:hypothetical protein
MKLFQIAVWTLAAISLGCSAKSAPSRMMGERVQVGSIAFTVIEADWLDHLETGTSPRIPVHRFLVVRLTAENAGTQEAMAPLLRVVDKEGKDTSELAEGTGVEEWWGLIRPLSPGQSVNRRIVFDVPPGDYDLSVSDGGDPGRERSALIRIPYRLRESTPLITPESPIPSDPSAR